MITMMPDYFHGCRDIFLTSHWNKYTITPTTVNISLIIMCIIKYKKLCCRRQVARDASCLSVVSFNSTIPRARSSIISYFGFRFTNAYNKILFCCLPRNVEASSHKQDPLIRGGTSSVSRDQQMPPLSAITHTPPSKCWRHPTVEQSSMPKTDIGRKSRVLPHLGGRQKLRILPQHFVWKKLEWCGYLTVRKCWRYNY